MSTNEINHLFFARHGESEHQVTGLTGGWTDTPLTGSGRDQVSATAVYLRARAFQNIGLYCSDLQRTMESADIIGSIWGCTPVPLAELRELNNGDAAQLTRLEAARIQNPEPKSEMSDWRPYANAETWREMIQRTSSALMKILSCDAKTTIVVGHGNSGQALIQARLELPLELEVSFQFDVASVTELRVNQWGEREIVRLNSIHDAWYLIRLNYSALWSEVNGVAFSIQCNMNSDTSIWSFRHLPLNLCDSRFGNAISHGWQSAACLFGVVAISFGSYNRRRSS